MRQHDLRVTAVARRSLLIMGRVWCASVLCTIRAIRTSAVLGSRTAPAGLRRTDQSRDRRRRPPRPRPSRSQEAQLGACAIAVVGPTGDLVYFEQDRHTANSPPSTISQHKARAAATFKPPDQGVRGPGRDRRRRRRRRSTLDGVIASEGGIPHHDRRQDRRRDGLQRRHRPAGRHGLPGWRQRVEIDRTNRFEIVLCRGQTPADFFSAPISLASHLIVDRGDVAERQQHRGPDERRGEIGDLETPVRHREHAGDQRHRGAQRPREAADEDRERAPLPDERLARRNDGRMLRQRPHVIDAVFELEADPVGQPVAERGADRARDPDRPEVEIAGADDARRCRPAPPRPGSTAK